MGAWGTKPFENDDASCIVNRVRDRITDGFRPGRKHFDDLHYNDARASAALMVIGETVFLWDADEIRMAMRRIDKISDDARWMREWNSPRTIRASVQRQREELEAMLQRRIRKDKRIAADTRKRAKRKAAH